MNAAAARFISSVLSLKERSPSFFSLAIFRMARTSMRYRDEALMSDKAYYDEHGWFESLYYTDVKIGLLKRMFGTMIDRFVKNMFLRENAKKELSQILIVFIRLE